MKNTSWQFSTAGNLKFGRGGRTQLPDALRRYHVQRPLLVTDRQLLEIEAVAQIVAGLKTRYPLAVFDGGCPEPAIEIANSAVDVGRAHSTDAVIGIGGGSNLDVAKIAACVLQHGGAPQDYFGFDRVPGAILPLFALPTTAGTGSEVSHSAVLTDVSQGTKVSTLSSWLRPKLALVDPELTDSCPPRVTAHSGIDALVHAIEAYTNRWFADIQTMDIEARAYEGSYPLTRLLAAEAIRLIGRSLVATFENPSCLTARDEMALAATLAGMAFSNSGVAVVHALEYPIGALTHCSHGEGNGLLLPHVMRFNLPARLMEFGDIARWLGADVIGRSQRQTAEAAVMAVENLLDDLAVTRRLQDLGLEIEKIPEVAAKALQVERLMEMNPIRPTLADLESILRAAY